MKKLLIGFLSSLLVVMSLFGASSRGPASRRGTAKGNGPDRVLWI
jgi:hypothetical protein